MKLRKLKLKDSLEMFEWISDPHINHYFKFSNKNYGITHVEKFIRDSWIDKSNIHLAIVNDFDEYMGTISLKNIDNDNDNAEYSISLRKTAIGTDVAKKSTDAILYLAFYILNLNKIYFNVLNRNTRAIKFYKKYGFQFEGTFVKHIKLSGIYQDLELYGIFKTQYSEINLCSIEEIPIMLDKSIYEIGFFDKNMDT